MEGVDSEVQRGHRRDQVQVVVGHHLELMGGSGQYVVSDYRLLLGTSGGGGALSVVSCR